MDDELWSADRQTERLRALRSEGTSVWRDSAAREVSARWLDPHDDLAGQFVAASRHQADGLAVAHRAQLEAEAQAQVAAARAGDTAAWLQELGDSAERAQAACAEADGAANRSSLATALARDETARARTILSSAR
ncbi:MAG TPA: hypothetical protein VEW93_15525 [Acidimicrobiales bacterium]|nr:hypothetical protein [Acidimicrobiales bacterium]